MRSENEERPEFPPSPDSESALYDGFLDETDRTKCRAVASATLNDLADFHPDFHDPRLEDLLLHYKARNFEIFRDLLADNGMASQAEHFLDASSRLQVLAYKYEIERNLRTRDYAGFQLLGLNDYSGQGTALVGPLNVHWREKQRPTPSPSRGEGSLITLTTDNATSNANQAPLPSGDWGLQSSHRCGCGPTKGSESPIRDGGQVGGGFWGSNPLYHPHQTLLSLPL
jgi:hypothetical protein